MRHIFAFLICSLITGFANAETVTLLCVNKLNQLTLTIDYDKSMVKDWFNKTYAAKIEPDSIAWHSVYNGHKSLNSLNRFTGLLTDSDNGTPLKCDIQKQRKF